MYKKIIVPLDGSDLAESVLPHVESIAKAFDTPEVTFVYAIRPRELYFNFAFQERERAAEYLERQVNRARAKGLNANYEILVGSSKEGITDYATDPAGDPAQSIADYAERKGADVIIIATHGRSGINRWLHGSVADKILRSCGVPVLVVRATETETVKVA